MLDWLKSLIVTRGTQLIARYVAALLIALSYHAEKAEADALTIAMAVTGVLLFGLDLVVHHLRARVAADTLKRFGLVLLLPLMLAGAGCGSAERRLTAANDLVAATYSSIADARDAGLITQAQIDPYREIRKSIDELLDDAGERVRAKDDAAADTVIAEIRRLVHVELRPLVNLIATARARKSAVPTPQPRPPP